ncbi:MAG: spore coat associated protein CotJA [Clostridiales bacterium]|nr:spore coat associated protein CotJA [Clostridiales bacterium]
MGYVPWQSFENVLCAKEGFEQGTIFADLILPFYGSPMRGNSGNGRRYQ